MAFNPKAVKGYNKHYRQIQGGGRVVRKVYRKAHHHPRYGVHLPSGRTVRKKPASRHVRGQVQQKVRRQRQAEQRRVRRFEPTAPFALLDRLGKQPRPYRIAPLRAQSSQAAKFRHDVTSGRIPIRYKIDKLQHVASGLDLKTGKQFRNKMVPVVVTSPQAEKRLKDKGFAAAAQRLSGAQSAALAPAEKVLEQTQRPVHAIAAAAKAGLEGKSVTRAASRGFRLKDKTYFSDVLKKAGVKGPVGAIAGTALDIGLDPTTYLTAGRGIPAELAAKAAAEKVAAGGARDVAVSAEKGVVKKTEKRAFRKAVKKGKPVETARQAGRQAAADTQASEGARRAGRAISHKSARAAQRARQAAPQGTGISLSAAPFGRHAQEMATARATAAVGRRVKRLRPVQKLAQTKAGQIPTSLRSFGSEFSPHVKPPAVGDVQFQGLKGAEREARATTTRGRFEAVALAKGLAARVPQQHYSDVIDAIERNTIPELPHVYARAQGVKRYIRKGGGAVENPAYTKALAEGEHTLAEPARAIQTAFRQARKREIKAGVKTPELQGAGYFTHQLQQDLVDEAQQGGVGRTVNPKFTKTRQYRGTMKKAEQQAAGEGKHVQFQRDVPVVVARRLAASAQDTARGRLNRSVLQYGRRVHPGTAFKVAPHEVVAVVQGKDLGFVDKMGERAIANGEVPKGAKYVAINERLAHRLSRGVAPGQERGLPTALLDKTTGGFKFLATIPNPGFHVRNLIGDTQNAYLAQPTHKLVPNLVRSAKGLHALSKREEALQALGRASRPGGKLMLTDKTGRKVETTMTAEVQNAIQSGALRAGFAGKELPELIRGGESAVKRVGKTRTGAAAKAVRAVKRLPQNREDLVRFATYLGARQKGLTAREAAAYVAKYHFDYADLSPTERNVMRRVFPFYTWTSRDVPLQAKSLLTKPGKYASIEKVRQEMAKQAGLPDDWQHNLKNWQGRAAPFPIKVGGKVVLVSAQFPFTDLNELPTSLNPVAFGTEAFYKSMSLLNPIFRTPAELSANYNYFFRSPIENDTSPKVAAPDFVGAWPDVVKRRLGIVKIIDKRTGKKVWGWPAKTDYVSKLVPGPVAFGMSIASSGTSRRGQSQSAKALSYIGGLKTDPYLPQAARQERLFSSLKQLTKRRAALSQQGIGSAQSGRRETREYRHIRDQIKRVTSEISKLSKQQGYKHPLLQRGRPASPGRPQGFGGTRGGAPPGFGGGGGGKPPGF